MECYRCGYCCKHYKLDGKTILAYMHEIADVDMDVNGPCKNRMIDKKETEKEGYKVYKCDVYNNRPTCCANLDAEKILSSNNISKEKLEEKILKGEDTPHCVVAKLLGKEYLSSVRQKI
ncbi:MAG: hypothetical protein Q8O03_08820 [Nanoarchaeota archaeon]|nr:hypothetical protein [Nanoarchaeota archaeon]